MQVRPALAPATLGSIAVGRRNNLNLLRFSAAMGVMASHTVLVTQGRDAMPGSMWLLGHVCVGAFFTISGYLVSGSWERAASAGDFVLARVLRVFPALIVCVLLTAFVLGPTVTSLDLRTYLAAPGTAAFVLGNLSLFWEVETLPGVFEGHPVSDAQITFWTLKHELVAYLGILALGLAGVLRSGRRFSAFLAAFVVLWLLALHVQTVAPQALPGPIASFRSLSIYFVLGMVAHRVRGHLYLTGFLCWPLAAATLLAWWTPLFHVLMPLTVAYGVLWLAFVPKGPLLRFNALGDYSYGVYVFAIPFQQLCVAVLGSHGPAENFFYAIGPTLWAAVLSWHLIERPSIAIRSSRSRSIRPSGTSGWSKA